MISIRHTKEKSTQELIGIESFRPYGLLTRQGELVIWQVAPTNISVLSKASIGLKIYRLMMVLSEIPNLELLCTDASECFDANKAYLKRRITEEDNPAVQSLLRQDLQFLDEIQVGLSSARQFFFLVRFSNCKEEQLFQTVNRMEKTFFEQGFEAHRLEKGEIKRVLALYFGASIQGEQIPDVDGAQYLSREGGT